MASELCSFPIQLQKTLREGQVTQAVGLFNHESNQADIISNSWDIIPILTEHLTEDKKRSNLEVFKCSEYLLMVIAEKSNAEEALLQFIAEIEEAKDDTVFISILNPLSSVLRRIAQRKVNSFAWSFNAIGTYLSKCETPEDSNLVGKEKLLLDSNSAVRTITKLYLQVIPFYEKQVTTILCKDNYDIECRMVLCKFLTSLLGTPLGYLDMEEFDNIKNQPRLIAENIVELIFKITSDPVALLELLFEKNSNELITPDKFALSILYYLIYAENVSVHKIPSIYNPIYTLHVTLCLINSLLEKGRNLTTEKGIKLTSSILSRIEGLKLSYSLLDNMEHSRFCKLLEHIIVYYTEESVRKTALGIFVKYLKSFELHGFYLILYNLMNSLTHSGLISVIVTLYKDVIAEELTKNEHNNIPVYCKGPKLYAMLKRFCYLPKSEETDLIDMSDQVIATLNLLRFLALRDKENVTKIWNYFGILEDKYLVCLRKGIDLSRAHYKLKIKEVNEEKPKKDNDMEVSVNVPGKGLPAMSKEEKLNVLNASLTAFDVMESILSRLLECIEYK